MFGKIYLRLRILKAFIALVRDPNKTEEIFEISDIARRRLGAKTVPGLEDLFASPEFKALHADRYNPKLDIAQLRALPQNTFGHEVAHFLDLNGFEPNTFPMLDADDQLEYLVSRFRQTHDLYHVLTGYATGVPDELALQGFMVSQIGSLLPVMLISGGLLHLIIFKPLDAVKTFHRIVEGYLRGKASEKLIMVRLEELFPLDLNEVRAKLKIPAQEKPALVLQQLA